MLFRRRAQAKEGSGAQPEASDTPFRAGGPPTGAAPDALRTASQPGASSTPPPLPAGTTESVAGGTSSEPTGRCFVCGSSLEAGTCPVCRIAWVE